MAYFNDLPPSLAQIAQIPACFDFPRRHAPVHFHHTGPWHEPAEEADQSFPWDWLDGRPLIYASLGTLQNGRIGLFQTILEACGSLPVQLVLALGRDSGPQPERIPPNAKVVGYAPQLALLRRAALVVTHGGMNTTLEALAHGLPLVALPITNDQPGVAARILHAGVGQWLNPNRLQPHRLRDAIQSVLGDGGFRARAGEIARRISGVGGLRRAVEIAERAVIERRRVERTEFE